MIQRSRNGTEDEIIGFVSLFIMFQEHGATFTVDYELYFRNRII